MRKTENISIHLNNQVRMEVEKCGAAFKTNLKILFIFEECTLLLAVVTEKIRTAGHNIMIMHFHWKERLSPFFSREQCRKCEAFS